ncbi:MAG: type II toxin-antitoxin system prevent-host-death family antitoxin [Pseudomonadota bacterium]|nr:type II toxin-antitoxin system prevent-host-death family antitoxin [Pseudomonadota bacterium]
MEVSVREFKSHLSSYLARAQTGEELVVTSHKLPVVRVLGITDTPSPGISAMLASGEAEWHGGKPAGARIKLVPLGKSLSDMVIEDRG